MGSCRPRRVISLGRLWNNWSLKASGRRGSGVHGISTFFDVLPHVVLLADYCHKIWTKGSQIQFAWILPSVTAAARTGTRKRQCHRLLLLSWLPSGAAAVSPGSGRPCAWARTHLPPRDGIQAPTACAVPHPQVRIRALSIHPCGDTPASLMLWLYLSWLKPFVMLSATSVALTLPRFLPGSITCTGLCWLVLRELQELQTSSAPCLWASMVLRRQGDSS